MGLLKDGAMLDTDSQKQSLELSTTRTIGRAADAPPIIRIEPSKGWGSLKLKELWQYRELLYFLTWRDVKVRYKQTVLGAAWAIIQPFFTMVVFSVFFGRLAGISSDGIPYPIFSYAALVPWTFFANGLTQSSNSLVGGAGLITKVYFPRLAMPIATVMAGLLFHSCPAGLPGRCDTLVCYERDKW